MSAAAEDIGVSLAEYLDWVETWYYQRGFTEGVAFPVGAMYPGNRGTIFAVSTAASTIQFNHNEARKKAGMLEGDSHWRQYAVWIFQDRTLLNFWGINNPTTGGSYGGLLHEVLDQVAFVPEWRREFGVRSGYLTGLRDLLRRLNVTYWLELKCGYSMREFRGLDFYVKVQPDQNPDSAWYLLCDRDIPKF